MNTNRLSSPDGTISLSNNVSFYSTIYLGDTVVKRDKTTNFDNINEM